MLKALVACGVLAAAIPAAAQDVKAVVGGTVIGGAGAPIPDAVVVIEGGRITQVGPRAAVKVPPAAVVVDAAGKFVMPGIADMHNHVRSGSMRTQQNGMSTLGLLLAYGVTTVFNPSSALTELTQMKAAAAPASAPLPRFFSTGPMVTVKGGSLGDPNAPAPETPADAVRVIGELKAAGADAIKVSRDDNRWSTRQRMPVMTRDVLNALVAEAHRQQLKVFVHAPILEYAKEALDAGVDGLLHGIIDSPVDQAFIDAMKRRGAFYVPTMSLYEDVADVAAWAKRQIDYDERALLAPIITGFTTPAVVRQLEAFLNNAAFTRDRLAVQRANLKRVFDAGIPVAMGTDTGFFGVFMGISSKLEMALMVEAGLTPADVIRAATLNGARMLGREKTSGSVEPGKDADLLILDANPLADIGNVRRIHRVIRGGTVHDPSQLLSTFRITGPSVPAK